MKTPRTARTVTVYSKGVPVAKRHSGHTMANPTAVQTAISDATFPPDIKDFTMEERILCIIFKPLKKTGSCFRKNLFSRKTAYSSEIAEVGHSPAHEPQLMHFSASILRALSSSEIALTGQTGSHVPQFTHLDLSILYAIHILL
jgi:hypothetical protein